MAKICFLQSTVKKDKKSVVQNNITIGTLVGNLHIGPSFTAIGSSPNTSRTSRVTSSDRHLEQCLSSGRIIEDEELELIAEAIGKSWKDVGKLLRVESQILNCLENDNMRPSKYKNAPYRMLYLWTQKYDKKATVGKLTKALCKAGEKDIVKQLRS